MNFPLRSLVGVTALLALAGCPKPSDNANEAKPADATVAQTAKPSVFAAVAPAADAVPVEFYVMSQCPYGVQALDAVIPALEKLGTAVDFKLNFIGQKGPDGSLSSMHGPNEVTGDIAQLCVNKLAPGALLNFLTCQNKNYRSVATNWADCGDKAGIPGESLKACINGDEGKGLLADSFDNSQKKGARGSPTIYVGGKSYRGQRTEAAFLRSICNAHSNAASVEVCANLPEIKPVNITIISDKRCGNDCIQGVMRAKSILSSRIGKPVFKDLDYSDAEGKALFDKTNAKRLPAILVDDTIKDDADAFRGLQRAMRPTPDAAYKLLPFGSEWDPVCMSEGGCDLEQCKGSMVCRPETPATLELFVMSECPFGVKALNAMEEVLKNFNGGLKFSVHFIGNEENGQLTSMHGQSEVDEDIRELCAINHYGKDYKYMDYVLCRNKNIRSKDWQSCTGANGIDTKVIADCFEGGEGKKLLSDDMKIANALNIGGSPTWIANGKHKFSGIDAETVRKNVCQHNPGLKGCENTLSGNSGAPVQGGCGN